MLSVKGSLLALASFLAGTCHGAMSIDVTNQADIASVADSLVSTALSAFNATANAGIVYEKPPSYWYEYGVLWAAVLDYSAFTGNSRYVANLTQAITTNAGPNFDFLPSQEVKSEGNDDQDLWTDAAMSAVEYNLPNASEAPSWLQMAQTVFDQQAQRWDTSSCGGGLRWQIFSFNNGYNYKNAISTGLFFDLAARLARNNGNKNTTYGEWAGKAYDWTQSVGLLSPQGDDIFVYDGADSLSNCSTVNHIQWSYNLGTFMHGCANMYAATQDSIWLNRAQSLLNAIKKDFLSPDAANVLYETACEPQGNCATDQILFKGITARWLGKVAVLLPQLDDQIMPILRASATGAVMNCQDAATCGTHWYTASFDGNTGPAQQLAVLEVVLSLTAGNANKSAAGVGTGQSSATNGSIAGGSNTSNTSSGNASMTTTNAGSQLAASGMILILLGLPLAIAVGLL